MVPIDETLKKCRLYQNIDIPCNPDQVAALVATGQMAIPTEIPPADRQELLAKIGRLRRRRLIHHIASVIATDIARGDP